MKEKDCNGIVSGLFNLEGDPFQKFLLYFVETISKGWAYHPDAD